jgi:gluconolactonase
MPLNGPNDIAVKSDGSFYFTDEYNVFRWKDGSLTRLTGSVVPGGPLVDGKPVARVVNGIALSLDEKSLYLVVVPPGAPRQIARYELRPDGSVGGEARPGKTLTDERVWVPLPAQNPPPTRESGQPDGIKVDVKGNVYFGGPGGIWIVSPQGRHLGTILIPGGHSNLAFGDSDGKSLYITLGNGLARVRLSTPAI